MNIYFNFLNSSIKLDNEKDFICDETPEDFISDPNKFSEKTHSNFLTIIHNNEKYFVHLSNLQWKE